MAAEASHYGTVRIESLPTNAPPLGGEDGRLMFSVRDNGPGFDPATVSRGSGLQNMADRIEALDGSLTFVSAVGDGTTITGWVPAVPVLATSAPTPH